tara:strand:- start:2035 stop:2238 length:204 start_codon:yes stop_codon:yes gene_type:complete
MVKCPDGEWVGYNIIKKNKKGVHGVTRCHNPRMVIARMVIDSRAVTAMQEYTIIIVWYYLPMVWESV